MVLIGKKLVVRADLISHAEVIGTKVAVYTKLGLLSTANFESEEAAEAAVNGVFLQAAAILNDDIEFVGNMASLAGFDVEAGAEIHEEDEGEAAEDVEVVPITEEMWDRFAAEAKALQDKAAPKPATDGRRQATPLHGDVRPRGVRGDRLPRPLG
jgi:hypothetical protein